MLLKNTFTNIISQTPNNSKNENVVSTLPDNLNDLQNLIIYGPSGVGKYTETLKIINKYSISNLQYEKGMNILEDGRRNMTHTKEEVFIEGRNSTGTTSEIAINNGQIDQGENRSDIDKFNLLTDACRREPAFTNPNFLTRVVEEYALVDYGSNSSLEKWDIGRYGPFDFIEKIRNRSLNLANDLGEREKISSSALDRKTDRAKKKRFSNRE